LVAAICQEIELQQNYLPTRTLETIYLGGGTPSLLNEHEMAQIFETIQRVYTIQSGAEITLEANPDDLSSQKLTELRRWVNRLSIGVQSFYEPYLRFMNRAHHAPESEKCVKSAQDSGFENITIDLMYGMSEKSLGITSTGSSSDEVLWQQDIKKAVALNITHISAYNLTIEPQTVLGKWLKKEKIKAVDEELSARQFEQMIHYFDSNGYEQYEISNFAKNNQYARHNSSYWKRRPYLGVGPSAHSFDGKSRQYNIPNNALYIKSLNNKKIPFEIEWLTVNDQVNDYLLTSLRTIWGCDLRIIKNIAGQSTTEALLPQINHFIKEEYLKNEANVLYLTPKGKLFADRIASDLFLV